MSEQTHAGATDSVRVSVWLGGTGVDASVPSRIPVAALIPALYRLAVEHGADPQACGQPRWLQLPGGAALDPERGLADNGIGDGAVLMLSTADQPGDPRPLSEAEEIAAATMRAARPWSVGAARAVGALAGVWAAGLVGFLAVPGLADPPLFDAPRLLLAGAAATTAALLGRRLCPETPGVFTALAAAAAPVWLAGLTGSILGSPVAGTGALIMLAALVLACAAVRLALRAGDPARFGALTAGAAAAAACGAFIAQTAAEVPAVGLSVCAAVVLAMRVPDERDAGRRVALLAGTAGCVSAAVVGCARTWPGQLAAVVGGVLGAAAGLGWLATLHPAGCPHRWPIPVGAVALAAMVPLAAWTLGLPGWPQ